MRDNLVNCLCLRYAECFEFLLLKKKKHTHKKRRNVTRLDVYGLISTHMKTITFDTTTRPRTLAAADVYVVGVRVVARRILAPVSPKTEIATPSYEGFKFDI